MASNHQRDRWAAEMAIGVRNAGSLTEAQLAVSLYPAKVRGASSIWLVRPEGVPEPVVLESVKPSNQ